MENDVVKELEAMLEKAQPLFTTESCCIYKVPHQIRQLNEDAYTPVLVSIGPLHHGNSRLVTMEGHKQFYCQHFIQRSEASLSDLVSCVQQLEQQIRACYSEKIDLTVDELVKVIFIDCCFIIELFLGDEWVRNDVIPSKSWMGNRVMQDLILLENQIPFFVFEKIYNLAFASRLHRGELPSFMWVAVSVFSDHNKQGVLPPAGGNIAHFTDLLRYLYLPPSHRIPSRNPGSLVLGHSASKLVEAGVKFAVNKPWHGIGILDLEFEHGILKIPHILVGDFDEVWLRNIVALEQCHYPHDHYVIDYVSFLTRLVNRDKDADVLIKAGIIESMMISGNDTSVAKLINDVDKNITVSNANANYLKICDDLKAYYKHPCHTRMATLRRDYFTTPWKTAASIAGIVLLLLTFVQTICSILQV